MYGEVDYHDFCDSMPRGCEDETVERDAFSHHNLSIKEGNYACLLRRRAQPNFRFLVSQTLSVTPRKDTN